MKMHAGNRRLWMAGTAARRKRLGLGISVG
jgi:hypothetical protein